MFDYISGNLAYKTQNSKGCYFTVDVNGIGYRAEVVASDYDKKNVNDDVRIFTVLIHREDAMLLCGFLSKEARDIFRVLTSVSGVGVKMALTLLNEFEISDLIYFVINENSKELTRAKGVGAKLAQKIVIELKDKFINLQPELKKSSISAEIPPQTEDVQNILLSLGYEENEILSAIKRAISKGHDVNNSEEFLRVTLQILSA
ncbi:MAG: Holliday junction branch migration protein RuvA [Candidatus Melainabacteria bacterium]|nr:MAG: Holliday junction branch migration protein RuvA [Candidatus Melainabacteria bacterium]